MKSNQLSPSMMKIELPCKRYTHIKLTFFQNALFSPFSAIFGSRERWWVWGGLESKKSKLISLFPSLFHAHSFLDMCMPCFSPLQALSSTSSLPVSSKLLVLALPGIRFTSQKAWWDPIVESFALMEQHSLVDNSHCLNVLLAYLILTFYYILSLEF